MEDASRSIRVRLEELGVLKIVLLVLAKESAVWCSESERWRTCVRDDDDGDEKKEGAWKELARIQN